MHWFFGGNYPVYVVDFRGQYFIQVVSANDLDGDIVIGTTETSHANDDTTLK